ncbi:muramoyltetrapeptide carboxypeptidase [Anaerosolibacter carboniphilus]|uniref:Muramoyltetrapeptide carboxypeptidase n=1 Tax=Anaerosolibacter carboniphilus TaxID=1417629 RepID=A0A841KJM9_9FIRM|nr:LD-carboxypeptidase [Anaerosolibacter carboniphilus]MBB6214074.1 muramoyltetrapeptide carboxypeptidase [Anaerosolibacter carboniphilus]
MKSKPKPLKPGDTIGIIAPGGPSTRDELERGVQVLQNMGFHVTLGESVFHKRGYLAGEDHIRLKDIHQMFQNKGVQGIICMRGGDGSGRLLDRIDYDVIAKNPKVFVGYSDITALHIAFLQEAKLVTFHGPMVTSDMITEGFNEYTREAFLKAISWEKPLGKLKNPEEDTMKTIVEGRAYGEIVGGNLALVTSTMGTPFELDTRGKLLFLEDIHEGVYRIDRMLNQLRLAGKLQEAAGIILGEFLDYEPENPEDSLTLEEVISDLVVPLNKPAIMGWKCGHGNYKLTIPLGVKGELNATDRQISIVETATQ